MIRLSDKKKLILCACTTAVGIAIAIPIGVGVLPMGLFALPILLGIVTISLPFIPDKDSIFR
jgi:hypothetical protein